MAKKGVFGQRIAFRITAGCSGGAQAAAPPRQGGLRCSSTTTKITPGLRPSPMNSSSATPSPPPPGLSSSRKNSSSTTTTPAPSTSLQGMPPSSSPKPQRQPQPSALPQASTSSSPSDVGFFYCEDSVLQPRLLPSPATAEDGSIVGSQPLLTGDESIGSGPVKLLASKRTYLSSPYCQMSPECQEPKLECDSQDWNEHTENNDQAVSLKLLASNQLRPHRAVLLNTLQSGKSLTEVAKCKSFRKKRSSNSQQNDIASHSADKSLKCCCHTHPMTRLDLFLLKRELTKIIELPGTSRSCRITSSARLEIRLILRRSIRLIYKLHKEGYCLEGSFGLANFLVDDSLFVSLEYNEKDRKNYSKQGACKDLQSFVKMVQSEIFLSQDIPSEIRRWLSMIEKRGIDYEYLVCYDCALMEHNQVLSTFMQLYSIEIMSWLSLIKKGGIDYEYLISYDCALMGHNQVLSTFMQLYSKLQAMQKSDKVGYKFVIKALKHFNGWDESDLHNRYFLETACGVDEKKRKWGDCGRWKSTYGSDVMSLLRLIRNTFQHITLKRFDKSGHIIFHEEDYEYILLDQFPNLLAELMEAMYIAAYLADLNLEHVMV